MTGPWRERCRPIIARVLAETAGRPEADIQKALFAAYPWGDRRRFPYPVWRSEVRHQRLLQRVRPVEGGEEGSR